MNAKQWLADAVDNGMSAKDLLACILNECSNDDIERWFGLTGEDLGRCGECDGELDRWGDCPVCTAEDESDVCEFCGEELDSDGDCANPYCNGLDHDDDDEIDYVEDSPAPLDPPLDTVVYPNLQDIIHALGEQGCYYDGHTLTRPVLRGPDDSLLFVVQAYGVPESFLWAEYAKHCMHVGFYHGAFSHLDSTALNGEPANNAPSGPSWSVYKDTFGWFVTTWDEPISTIKLTNGVMTTITYILDFETDTYFEVIDQANPHWLLHFPKEYWSRG